jgi:hypothetical protein
LIAFDPANDLIYAATFEQGVMRSDDDGATWTSLGYAGHFIRGIAIDPADPNVLYTAAYGEGIFKTTTASTDGTFTKLPTSLTKVEELLSVGSVLYAAAGPAGVQASTDGGATWSKLGGSSFPSAGPVWESIDGYELCGQTVLYAGADRGSAKGVIRSLDGGTTWTSLVADPTRIHDEIGGPGGDHWWMFAQASFLPGGSSFTASMVVVDPVDPPGGPCIQHGVFVAGRSGIWRATDGGVDWYPMMTGLGVSIVRAVAFDPAAPNRLFAGMADWVHLYSTDGGTHVVQKRPRGGNTAFDVEFNPGLVPGRVYVASGSPSANVGGEVFSNPNPATSGWTSEGLAAVAHGARPLAIAVRQVSGVRVLVVATEGNGIWRKQGSTWTHVSTAAMAGFEGTRAASMVWTAGGSSTCLNGNGCIYLYDHRSGVWRSNDMGKTWTRIWVQKSSGMHTGFVAVDPSSPTTLWVSVGGVGVFRLSGANVGTVGAGQIVPVPVGPFAAPGAIAVSSGTLYVATVAQGGPAELYRSDDQGANFVPAGDALWAGAAGYVYDLEVAPNGDLYAALNGDGLLRGTPAP